MNEMDKRVLAILAHPDDAEIMCAGTLVLLKEAGWEVHMATMTPGDKGSAEHTQQEISEIRMSEARNSAKIIDAPYYCVGLEDLFVLYNEESITKTTALIRKVKPTVVITASPVDYMVDHETTAKIVVTACFSAGIKNLETGEPPFEFTPYLYYCDAMDGMDKLGNPIDPAFYVDITTTMPVKEKMLGTHASQRNWLLKHHKMDEYILAMKRFARLRGEEAKVEYAEGFRQHLGHGFPHDNVLAESLKKYIVTR